MGASLVEDTAVPVGLWLAVAHPLAFGLLFIVVLVLTVVILIYLRVTGREDWMRRAQLVFEQSGGGH